MRQRTFLIALLTLLAATIGLTACASSSQDHPTPTPTLTPTKPKTPTPEVPEIPIGRLERPALVGAIDWTKRNHSMLADALIEQTGPAAPFLDRSITAQIRENARVDVKFPVAAANNTGIDFIVPAEITSTFNVNEPVIGGTYKATLPVSLFVDINLPMEDRVTSHRIETDKFSLEKQ